MFKIYSTMGHSLFLTEHRYRILQNKLTEIVTYLGFVIRSDGKSIHEQIQEIKNCLIF